MPLKIGDTLELNDHRGVVVGICRITQTFQANPVIYTTYSRATTFAPQQRNLLSFFAAKAKPDQDLIYSFELGYLPMFAGQQMDVFIGASKQPQNRGGTNPTFLTKSTK